MKILQLIATIIFILNIFSIILGNIFIQTECEKKIRAHIIFNLISVAIFIVCVFTIKNTYLPDQKRYIHSVKKESEIHGSFAMFGGTIDQEQYYFVYEKDKYGYLLKKYNTDQTRIVEDENKHPYVVRKDALFKDSATYILHVPKNTLVLQYRIE